MLLVDRPVVLAAPAQVPLAVSVVMLVDLAVVLLVFVVVLRYPEQFHPPPAP